MSRKNNVNPDHYKVAGRDRQGEDVVHEQQRQALASEQARLARQKKPRPGGAATGTGRPAREDDDEGEER